MTLEEVARLYAIPLIDYERPSNGLLLSSGCGLMMSVMDAVPELRYCVDVGPMKSPRLKDFLLFARRMVSPIGVVAWFSVTSPSKILDACEGLEDVVLYLGHVETSHPGQVPSLADFVRAMAQRGAASGHVSG